MRSIVELIKSDIRSQKLDLLLEIFKMMLHYEIHDKMFFRFQNKTLLKIM